MSNQPDGLGEWFEAFDQLTRHVFNLVDEAHAIAQYDNDTIFICGALTLIEQQLDWIFS